MKKITLHRAAADNTGAFVDAGVDLVVGDKAEAGTIDAVRARELVDSHGAVEVKAVSTTSVDKA